MKKRKRKMLIITMLLTIEIFTIFLSWKSFTAQPTSLEEVNLKEVKKNNLAIMVNEGDGNYQENSSGIFPTEGYKFNESKSGCINNDGLKIDNALTFESGQVKVKVEQTSSCYLYFDKILGKTALELLAQKPANLNQSLEGGLHRYQGTADTVINNYICFGTSDKSTCIGDHDKYMYRIIGINESGQFKLIKKESLNTAYYWHNVNNTNTIWNNSDLYKGLNGMSGGTYNNLFIGNTSYIPNDTWKNKIEDTSWKYGDNTNVNQTPSTLYNIENGWSDTTDAKIGLMYVHDYDYALQSGGMNCAGGTEGKICKTSWIYLWDSGNDNNPPNTDYEWTMSRCGSTNDKYYSWIVSSNGYFNSNGLYATHSVRPVFFLESTVQIAGEGTLTSPYVITN